MQACGTHFSRLLASESKSIKMGSCISTCRPKKHSLEEFKHVQDKLVISQAPKTPIPHQYSNKISPSPPSPPTSTSSTSSLSCTAGSTTASSCSSLSSSASSVLSSKDRSFSSEFLWSCVKANPHIVRINSIRENAILFSPAKVYAQKPDLVSKPMVAPVKHSIPKKVASSTPQKRVRSSSPTPLPRQKSFRREPEGSSPAYSVPNRIQRSPSPSWRYNGDRYRAFLTNTSIESHSKRMVGLRSNTVSSVPSSVRNETLRPASPSNSSRRRPYLRNREMQIHRVGSKIDEVAVGKAVSDHDMDSIPMEEDIDNPLISLDCFIFL
ncbi:hypothetical protein CIPAW_16G021200 [Carya illinoinensis]|uniref:Uncharacterized protein n=2 Tax=Carya illinoinensis TaxID=32201 RepID=A0A8T1N1J9_CARIL|nr:hypothetical protein CIPAW_16G021200 [Carya illinoinensis]